MAAHPPGQPRPGSSTRSAGGGSEPGLRVERRYGEVLVRPATQRDVDATAALHARSLGHGFLVRLGPRFLRAWHRATLDTTSGLLLVAVVPSGPGPGLGPGPGSAGRVVGFLLGSSDQGAHMTELLRGQRRRLLPPAAVGLLTHPRLAWFFARTRAPRYLDRLLHPRGTAPAAPETPGQRVACPDRVAVVEGVAVAEQGRGQGVGEVLLRAFTRAAQAAGAARAEAVTLDGPGGAAGFYTSQGWTLVDTHQDRDGHGVRRYRVALPRLDEAGR